MANVIQVTVGGGGYVYDHHWDRMVPENSQEAEMNKAEVKAVARIAYGMMLGMMLGMILVVGAAIV